MNDTNTNPQAIAKKLTAGQIDALDFYCDLEDVKRASGSHCADQLAGLGLLAGRTETIPEYAGRAAYEYTRAAWPIVVTDLGFAVQKATAGRTTRQRKIRTARERYSLETRSWSGHVRRDDGLSDLWIRLDDEAAPEPSVGDKVYVYAQGAFRCGIAFRVSKRVEVYYTNKSAGTEYLRPSGRNEVFVRRLETPPTDDAPDYEETVEEEAERLTTPSDETFAAKLKRETEEAGGRLEISVDALVEGRVETVTAPKLKATRTGKDGLYTVATKIGTVTIRRGARRYDKALHTHVRDWKALSLDCKDALGLAEDQILADPTVRAFCSTRLEALSKTKLLEATSSFVEAQLAAREAPKTGPGVAVPRSTAKPTLDLCKGCGNLYKLGEACEKCPKTATAADAPAPAFVNPPTKRLTAAQKKKAAKELILEDCAQLAAAFRRLASEVDFDAAKLRELAEPASAAACELRRLADEVEAFYCDPKDAKAAHKAVSKRALRFVVRSHEWGFVPSGSPKASDEAKDLGLVSNDEQRSTRSLRLTALGRAVAKLAGAKPADRRVRPFAGIEAVEAATFSREEAIEIATCSLCGQPAGSNAADCARCEGNAEEPPVRAIFTEADEKEAIERMQAENADKRLEKRVRRLEVLAPLARVVRVGIVSCGKTKADAPAKVRDLYQSSLFRKSVAHAAKVCDEVLVASAKHGLLALDDEVAPYDATLTKLTKREVSRWETLVHAQLRLLYPAPVVVELVVYAGSAYTDSIGAAMPRTASITCPLAGLAVGKRLQRLGSESFLETLRADLADREELRPDVLEELRAYDPKPVAFTEEDGDTMVAELVEAGLALPSIVSLPPTIDLGGGAVAEVPHLTRNERATLRALLADEHVPCWSEMTVASLRTFGLLEEHTTKLTRLGKKVAAILPAESFSPSELGADVDGLGSTPSADEDEPRAPETVPDVQAVASPENAPQSASEPVARIGRELTRCEQLEAQLRTLLEAARPFAGAGALAEAVADSETLLEGPVDPRQCAFSFSAQLEAASR